MQTGAVKTHYDLHPFPQTSDDTILLRAKRFKEAFPLLALQGPCRVLDAGCGTGSFANTFAVFNPEAQIDAINISPVSLQWGIDQAQRMNINNVHFSEKSIFDHPNKIYDLVVSHGVLHHTGDADKGLNLLCRMVAPDGLLSVTLYHLGRWPTRFRRMLLAALHGSNNPVPRLQTAKTLFPRSCRDHLQKGGLTASSTEIQDAALADMFAVPIETYHSYTSTVHALKANEFNIVFRSSDKGRSVSLLARLMPLDMILDIKGLLLRQKQFHIIGKLQ